MLKNATIMVTEGKSYGHLERHEAGYAKAETVMEGMEAKGHRPSGEDGNSRRASGKRIQDDKLQD